VESIEENKAIKLRLETLENVIKKEKKKE